MGEATDLPSAVVSPVLTSFQLPTIAFESSAQALRPMTRNNSASIDSFLKTFSRQVNLL